MAAAQFQRQARSAARSERLSAVRHTLIGTFSRPGFTRRAAVLSGAASARGCAHLSASVCGAPGRDEGSAPDVGELTPVEHGAAPLIVRGRAGDRTESAGVKFSRAGRAGERERVGARAVAGRFVAAPPASPGLATLPRMRAASAQEAFLHGRAQTEVILRSKLPEANAARRSKLVAQLSFCRHFSSFS